MKRGRTISEAEFRRMWLDPNATVSSIADHLGITPSAVRFRAKSRGLGKRPVQHPRKRAITDTARFSELWNGNVMTKDIAAHFGVAQSVVPDTADHLGLASRGKSWGHKTITLEEYAQFSLARRMAESAARTQAEMIRRDMADNTNGGSVPTGFYHARGVQA